MIPQRSTFCFIHNKLAYLYHKDLITLKTQWDTFERVENHNSIIYSTLTGLSTVGISSTDNSPTHPFFYTL